MPDKEINIELIEEFRKILSGNYNLEDILKFQSRSLYNFSSEEGELLISEIDDLLKRVLKTDMIGVKLVLKCCKFYNDNFSNQQLLQLPSVSIAYNEDLNYNHVGVAKKLQNLLNSQFKSLEGLDKLIEDYTKGIKIDPNKLKEIQKKSQKKLNELKVVFNEPSRLSENNVTERMTKFTGISKEKQDEYRQYIEKKQKNPTYTLMDGREITQGITSTYESFRYVDGFLLALFDYIYDDMHEIGKYFDKNHNPFGDMYSYGRNRKGNFWRKGSKSLSEYLILEENKFKNTKEILDWVHKEQRKKRISESHHLYDIKQDKLHERKFALLIKGKKQSLKKQYFKIEELGNILSDLSQLLFVFFLIFSVSTQNFDVNYHLKKILDEIKKVNDI